MKEERKKILQMLAEGIINADEAEELLTTVEQGPMEPKSTFNRRFFRIRVADGPSTKVNVNIPISLAKMAFRFVPSKILQENPELDFDAIIQEIQAGAQGKLVEVQDGETTVEIFVD